MIGSGIGPGSSIVHPDFQERTSHKCKGCREIENGKALELKTDQSKAKYVSHEPDLSTIWLLRFFVLLDSFVAGDPQSQFKNVYFADWVARVFLPKNLESGLLQEFNSNNYKTVVFNFSTGSIPTVHCQQTSNMFWWGALVCKMHPQLYGSCTKWLARAV